MLEVVALSALTAFWTAVGNGAAGEMGKQLALSRALTDLAETLHYAGDDGAALRRISEAERLLSPTAGPHLRYLAGLRQRCTDGGQGRR